MNKPGLFVRGAEGLRGEEFERNRALELRVFGLEDHTHPTFPEFLEDLAMRDGFADQKWLRSAKKSGGMSFLGVESTSGQR